MAPLWLLFFLLTLATCQPSPLPSPAPTFDYFSNNTWDGIYIASTPKAMKLRDIMNCPDDSHLGTSIGLTWGRYNCSLVYSSDFSSTVNSTEIIKKINITSPSFTHLFVASTTSAVSQVTSPTLFSDLGYCLTTTACYPGVCAPQYAQNEFDIGVFAKPSNVLRPTSLGELSPLGSWGGGYRARFYFNNLYPGNSMGFVPSGATLDKSLQNNQDRTHWYARIKGSNASDYYFASGKDNFYNASRRMSWSLDASSTWGYGGGRIGLKETYISTAYRLVFACSTNGPATYSPTPKPTLSPTAQNTFSPTGQPTRQPTNRPSRQPTSQPTRQPTSRPSSPSGQPTRQPTRQPTVQPSRWSSVFLSRRPTGQPSEQPSSRPSRSPTGQPSRYPTGQPSGQPTSHPSRQPTGQPSGQPTRQPTSRPSSPSGQPSGQPTRQPSAQPSSQPTRIRSFRLFVHALESPSSWHAILVF